MHGFGARVARSWREWFEAQQRVQQLSVGYVLEDDSGDGLLYFKTKAEAAQSAARLMQLEKVQ